MAVQQLGVAPSNSLDAATKAYVDAKASSGSSGTSTPNLIVAQNNPGLTVGGIWVQTDSNGNVVTFWVENGTTAAPPTSGLVDRFSTAALSGYSNGAGVYSMSASTGDLVITESSTPPTYLASGLNNKPGLTFNGSTNKLSYSSGNSYNTQQPYSLVAIVNLKDASSSQQIINTSGAEMSLNSGALGYTTYSGTAASGGTVTTGAHLIVVGIDAGGAGSIAVDGTSVVSSNFGTNGMASIRIGAHPNNSQYANMDGYEFMIYSKNLLNTANASDYSTLKSFARSQFALTIAGS